MPGQRRVLLVVGLYHLANDGAVQVLAGQIAILAGVFAFGPFETGILVGTALLVNAIGQMVFGVMSDRRDPSRFLPIGILVVGISSVLVATSQSFLMLLIFVPLLRLGASFFHPVGLAWIAREYRGPELDRAMGLQSGTGDAGEILGMATGAVLGFALVWYAPFLLWAAVNLLAVAIGWSLFRDRPTPPATVDPPRWGDLLTTLRDVRLWVVPLAVGSISYNVISYFGPLLLSLHFGLRDDIAGLSIAVWLVVGTAVALGFGRLSRRFGRFPLTVFAYAAVGTGSFLAAILANEVLVLLSIWSLGAGLFLTYPAIFAYASEVGSTKLQGAAFGFVFFFQLLGGALGSFVAGILAALLAGTGDLAVTAPFWLSAIVAWATTAYLVALRRHGALGAPAAAPAHPQP